MAPATEIKAQDVQKLRQTTGAGLMDCKKALVDAGGDFEKAIQLLREKGIAKSSKRADRVAGEGLVDTWISPDGKEGVLLEMNCETDFVARNEEFVKLAKNIINQIKDNPSWTSPDQILQQPIQDLSAKIGEKLEARRFVRFKSPHGIVSAYIHAGSKLGVLTQIDSLKGATEGLKELAKEINLQIAGMAPSYIHQKEVPAEAIEREKEIAKKQLEGQNKPAEILEKIAIGKLQQFYASQCLLDQVYVKDEAKKTTIKDLVAQAAKKDGTDFTVARFARFRVGAD